MSRRGRTRGVDAAEQMRGRTLTVGFTPPAASEFYDEIEHGAFSAMHALSARYGVRWQWSPFFPDEHQDVSDQVEVIRDWASRAYDAILVCTAGDFPLMQRVYAEAATRGTRIFQFNMPAELWPADQMRAVSTIGYDNAKQAGYLAGDYIARTLEGQGKLILIWGLPGHWATARLNGLRLALRRYPGIQLAALQRGDYVREKGFEAAERLLQRIAGVQAIYAENEEMAIGASQAVEARGLHHWDGTSGIITIGADGLRSGYQRIKDGRLTATIDVGPVELGRRTVQSVFWDAVHGAVPRHVVELPTLVVDRTNVDEPLARVTWALGVPGV